MAESLLDRIGALIHQVLESYSGAWLVWCDPRGDWLPLLQQVASGPCGFTLHLVEVELAGQPGSLKARAELQARIATGDPFVLHVPRAADELGWVWAQALLAERIYDQPLRDQLREWGWSPHSLTMSDEEVAALARRSLHEDPAEWGGASLQPDKALLLEVLAGGAQLVSDQRYLLDHTIEQAGLPKLDEANLPRWRTACLARLLVTEAQALAPALIPEEHELLISRAQRSFARQVLADWTDSIRLSRGLPEAILEADRVAGLGALAVSDGGLEGPFLSHAAEQAVFAALCNRLAELSGQELLVELAELEAVLGRHAQGFWGVGCQHAKAIPWLELERLSHAARLLLEASLTRPWSSPPEAIDWYTSEGWRADRAGEEILRDLSRPAPALLTVITPLREAYRARWEQAMIEWSRVWIEAGCPVPDVPSAGEWLAGQLEQKRPTAILLLDALRYDLGYALAERVNHQEGTRRAKLASARAPLPSITSLGMTLALPLPEAQLEADLVGGKWQVRQVDRDADLSSAAARRTWWLEQGAVPTDALLDMGGLLNAEVPAPKENRTRLVVYDAAIDKLGHDDQLEAQGTSAVLDRYLLAVERLRTAGWLRILVVTDHGYIHWPASEEKNAPPPVAVPQPVYSSRRALAYPAQVMFTGPQGLAPGGRWRVAVPYGAASFRAYGGLGYFHGGASLQEWIIPCLKVEWPLQARPVGVALQPLPQVLGQRQRIPLLVERGSLLIEDATPRQVEVVIRDAGTHRILFRSLAVSITPDRELVDVTVTALEGMVAVRGAALRIEVRDSGTEQVLDTGESMLAIDLAGW